VGDEALGQLARATAAAGVTSVEPLHREGPSERTTFLISFVSIWL
jgi:hypothetical protein